jgi:hypothetical protein
MRIATLLCFCFTFLVSSCTMAPKVANHNYSTQEKMESVAHWQALAKEVVEMQVLPSLPVNPELSQVYVDNSDTTEFGKAFYNYLVTELMNHGVMISQTPDEANIVKWGTQLVWNSKEPWPSGVFVGAVEAVGFFLAGSSVGCPPDTIELIVTTQVNRDYMMLSRMTHNYYINESSRWNFWVAKNGEKLDWVAKYGDRYSRR